MIKNSIGELKLSPLKEDGKFVFYNDFITINGKVSRGDKITVYVASYTFTNGKYIIENTTDNSAELIVRGVKHSYPSLGQFSTVADLYNHVADLYRERFYFGSKV